MTPRLPSPEGLGSPGARQEQLAALAAAAPPPSAVGGAPPKQPWDPAQVWVQTVFESPRCAPTSARPPPDLRAAPRRAAPRADPSPHPRPRHLPPLVSASRLGLSWDSSEPRMRSVRLVHNIITPEEAEELVALGKGRCHLRPPPPPPPLRAHNQGAPRVPSTPPRRAGTRARAPRAPARTTTAPPRARCCLGATPWCVRSGSGWRTWSDTPTPTSSPCKGCAASAAARAAPRRQHAPAPRRPSIAALPLLISDAPPPISPDLPRPPQVRYVPGQHYKPHHDFYNACETWLDGASPVAAAPRPPRPLRTLVSLPPPAPRPPPPALRPPTRPRASRTQETGTSPSLST